MRMPAGVSRRLFVLALGAAATGGLYAGTISGPACVQGTFTAYQRLSQSGGCNSGPIQLFGFQLFTVDINGSPTAASSTLTNAISVSPVFSQEGSNGDMRMIINGFDAFPVSVESTQGYRIDFTADPAPVMSGMQGDFDPPFGNDVGTTTYCGDPFGLTPGCAAPGSFGFSFSRGANNPGRVTFPFLLTTLQTQTTFRLNPNQNIASGIDGVVFDIFTTSAVPEPGTWLSAGLGLLLAAYRRRSFKG